LDEGDVTNAVTAQSMAMFLHSLDDHLVDGQVSVTPLTLFLRSQAWTIMTRAFCNLADENAPLRLFRFIHTCEDLGVKVILGEQSMEYCLFKWIHTLGTAEY
jgi:hypothetical protein